VSSPDNGGGGDGSGVYDRKHPNHGVGAALDVSLPPHRSPLEPAADEGNWTRGEVQPRRCNDPIFALLFWAHLGVMAAVAAVFAPRMFGEVAENAANAMNDVGERDLMYGLAEEEEEGAMMMEVDEAEEGKTMMEVADGYNMDVSGANESIGTKFASWIMRSALPILAKASSFSSLEDDDHGVRRLQDDNEAVVGTADMMLLLVISAVISLVISSGALGFMIGHAQLLIKFALLFNIGLTLLFAIGSLFLSPFAAITGIFLFTITVYYAYVVWGRIPFAACNLVTATTAVRSNLGLAFFAYSSLLVMIGWSAWWLVSFVSTMYVVSGCDGQGNCERDPGGIVLFALLLSYHWTFQVIKNVVHVTVAGTVGTWWFVPTEGSSCCSNGVRDSFARSVTTSFGSICMGSLLVAIIEAAKSMVRHLRESEDGGGILLCLAECLLSCLQDVMEYFNMWAFVFVGLYGYGFIESGKNVINLFKTRGWTTIITDNLAQGVLAMVSIAVGLITGLVALGVSHAKGMVFGDELGASAAAFFIGFIIGAVLTSTLMTLVSSAVNTVIVCYAEAPAEFQQNHPELSEEMRATWRQAWPAEFCY